MSKAYNKSLFTILYDIEHFIKKRNVPQKHQVLEEVHKPNRSSVWYSSKNITPFLVPDALGKLFEREDMKFKEYSSLDPTWEVHIRDTPIFKNQSKIPCFIDTLLGTRLKPITVAETFSSDHNLANCARANITHHSYRFVSRIHHLEYIVNFELVSLVGI